MHVFCGKCTGRTGHWQVLAPSAAYTVRDAKVGAARFASYTE